MKIFFALILCCQLVFAQNIENQIVYKKGFILSYNESYEQANWVFYVLKNTDLCKDSAKRNDNFREDKSISTGSADPSDYRGSNYDRGHLKPAGDESCNQEEMNETFMMSNISPQTPSFNRGIWKKLEEEVRNFARKNDSIYVYTGGVLKNIDERIGNNKVAVPKYFYKVIYIFNNGQVESIAYLIPNKKSTKDLIDYKCDINKIKNETGIIFPDPYSKNRLPKIVTIKN